MKVVEVTTVCTATVMERWVLGITDDEAAMVAEHPQEALTLIAESEPIVILVENTNVSDEQDRHVLETKELF